jgi:hypothetical protein
LFPQIPVRSVIYGQVIGECRKSDLYIFFQCDSRSDRLGHLHEYLGTATIPPGLRFNYSFVGFSDWNQTDPPYLAPSRRYRDIARSAILNGNIWSRFLVDYFFIFDYAAHETDFRWILRAFDDMIPNMDLLLPLVRHLDLQYDPLTQFVVRGNCIAKRHGAYPQGGVGTILSHFACQQLSARATEAIRGYINNSFPEIADDLYDDSYFGFFLKSLGIDIAETQSTAFLGRRFEGAGAIAMETGVFTGLPLCPEKIDQWGCRRFLSPVRDIVFHHEGAQTPRSRNFTDHYRIMRNLWTAPENIQFHMGEYNLMVIPQMCQNPAPQTSGPRFLHA